MSVKASLVVGTVEWQAVLEPVDREGDLTLDVALKHDPAGK